MEPVFSDLLSAATVWQKYDPLSIVAPELEEWCLWSMTIQGHRDYFAGRLTSGKMRIVLHLDGFQTIDVDDSLYYARINHIIFEKDDHETN